MFGHERRSRFLPRAVVQHMTKPRNLIVIPGPAFPETAAHWIADRIERALADRATCSIALSGGNTPRPVYRRLAGIGLPWERVHVFFADERRVPPDDERSNFRLVRETLLAHLPVQPDVHRMKGEEADGDVAAAAYATELPDALDVVVLGMGDDGHTASLFPGSPALHERDRRVLAVPGPPDSPDRLTLTPPALEAAHHRVVLVSGAGKSSVVAEVFDADPDPLAHPIQLALNDTWILDAAAAADVDRGG